MKSDIKELYEDTWLQYRLYAESNQLSMHYIMENRGVEDPDYTFERYAEKLEVNSGHKLLDIGCGVGGNSMWMAENVGCEATGVDITPKMIKEAQKYAEKRNIERVSFQEADFENLPFGDESFDRVIGTETVCHSRNLEKVFSEIYRVLKPGGKALIVDGFRAKKNMTGEEEKIVDIVEEGWSLDRFYFPEEYVQNSEKAGFDASYEEISEEVMLFSRNLHDFQKKFRTLKIFKFLNAIDLKSENSVKNIHTAIEQYNTLERGLTEYGWLELEKE